MKKLTIEKAYELAVKKWEYIVENNGSEYGMEDAISELSELYNDCSYCELFYSKGGYGGCKGCPLKPKRKLNAKESGCCQKNHPFTIWVHNRTKSNAQAVLDLIIKTKPI